MLGFYSNTDKGGNKMKLKCQNLNEDGTYNLKFVNADEPKEEIKEEIKKEEKKVASKKAKEKK